MPTSSCSTSPHSSPWGAAGARRRHSRREQGLARRSVAAAALGMRDVGDIESAIAIRRGFLGKANKEVCRLRVELAMASRRHPARPGETYTGWAVNFREATLPSLAEGRRSLYPRRRESRPLPRTDARGALASRAATVAHCGDRSAGGASRSRAILTPRHSVRERSARTDSRQP